MSEVTQDYETMRTNRAYRSYAMGFLISLLCTSIVYIIVTRHALASPVVVSIIVALALIQFFAQLVLFLHIGREVGPRWRVAAFALMVLVVGILIGGSLWIMYNLNYRMMSYPSPQAINSYMSKQNDGL